MPYEVSLTSWTSRNFATAAKLVAIIFAAGSIILTLVWVHAEDLWWFIATAAYTVASIVFVFVWVIYQHEKDHRMRLEAELSRVQETLYTLKMRDVNIQQAAPMPLPAEPAPKQKGGVPASPESVELDIDFYYKLEDYRRKWEDDMRRKGVKIPDDAARQQIGFPRNEAGGWYFDHRTGQYKQR